jgi:hypothetical protein
MAWKTTKPKQNQQCCKCGCVIVAHQPAWYATRSKLYICTSCSPQRTPAPDAPQPSPDGSPARPEKVPHYAGSKEYQQLENVPNSAWNWKEYPRPSNPAKPFKIAESYVDFDTFARIVQGRPAHYTGASRSRRIAGADWDLLAGFGGAVNMMLHGWPEGREFASRMAGKLGDISGRVVRFKTVMDVAGFAPDVGVFCAGAPDCMFHYETHEAEAKAQASIVRVCVNISASGGVPAEALAVKGLAVSTLVEALQTAGKSVELTVCEGCLSSRDGDGYQWFLTLKEADAVMESDRLAYFLGHPAVLRRLGFAYTENAPKAFGGVLEVHSSYGTPRETWGGKPGDIHVGHNHLLETNWKNMDVVRKWITDQLTAQGVTLEGV